MNSIIILKNQTRFTENFSKFDSAFFSVKTAAAQAVTFTKDVFDWTFDAAIEWVLDIAEMGEACANTIMQLIVILFKLVFFIVTLPFEILRLCLFIIFFQKAMNSQLS